MDRLLEATARAERDHFWFHGFRRFVAPLLERATAGRRDPLILDCGCGTGNNLTMLRRYGRACGIDITWSGLAYARRRGETHRRTRLGDPTALPGRPVRSRHLVRRPLRLRRRDGAGRAQ